MKEKINKIRNTQKGITIVALVITIIVMLLLALVSINIMQNQGIIPKSKEAVEKYQEEEIKEQIKLAYSEWQMSQYNGDTKDVEDFMQEKLRETLGNENITVTESNGEITVITTVNGNGKEKGYEYDVSTGKVEGYTYISKTTEANFVGYYADIDKDGTVDGVIFVDLLTGSIKKEQKWGNISYGVYTLPTNVTESNVNAYYISAESYTDSHFGTHPVISPKNTNGEKRFYIMGLSDFKTERKLKEDGTEEYPAYTTYYWYKKALNKMNTSDTSVKFGAGKTNTGKMIEIWNKNGGEGGYSGATQANQDIWKHIQTKYNEGWFIPSGAEWSAFANEMEITKDNYKSKYGLSSNYCSSSQCSSFTSFDAEFTKECIFPYNVTLTRYVRLATTF